VISFQEACRIVGCSDAELDALLWPKDPDLPWPASIEFVAQSVKAGDKIEVVCWDDSQRPALLAFAAKRAERRLGDIRMTAQVPTQ
jgi:hypothetical protein